MPKGAPKAQTRATMKYEAANGWKACTYKLRKETADAFKAACESAGVSQASQLMKMMDEFVTQAK